MTLGMILGISTRGITVRIGITQLRGTTLGIGGGVRIMLTIITTITTGGIRFRRITLTEVRAAVAGYMPTRVIADMPQVPLRLVQVVQHQSGAEERQM